MSRCDHCGNELTEFVQTCPNCGQPITQEPPAAPSGSRPVEPLPLGDYLKAGWELFKQYPGGFMGFFLVYLVVEMVLNLIPYFGAVAGFVVGPALIMGNFLVSAKLQQRQTPSFQDFFGGFNFFLPLLLTGLTTAILVTLGLLLLVLPGVYLAVSYAFAPYLVIDRRMDFWQAMELSRRTVQPVWFGIFALLLLLLVINLAGALLLGLGLLVTVPLIFCTLTVAYGDIFGWQSTYADPIPRLRQP